MADKAFHIVVMETFASLMTAAFGLVAALAWNDAIKTAIQTVFVNNIGLGQFAYAVIVTVIAVVATIIIARSLAKMKAAVGSQEVSGEAQAVWKK
ncbi:MAG TPA: DUF5654 family protein [Methanomassiliicoccales archaeon]|nr:DUF5654 family protein [Methanomassiliicoccales archaeon]